MAEGILTFEEFWKLSEYDRGKRYVELSDHDKFRVRLSMPLGVNNVPCNDCIHYLGFAKCVAYPEHISGSHMDAVEKDLNTPCGNGFQFQQKK